MECKIITERKSLTEYADVQNELLNLSERFEQPVESNVISAILLFTIGHFYIRKKFTEIEIIGWHSIKKQNVRIN